MPERWKPWLLSCLGVLGLVLAGAIPSAYAGVPDVQQSFYVPQAGNTTTPLEGASTPKSFSFFRGCPNNDGASYPNNARIKVVARDSNGNGIPGVSAQDICLLFNGGTPAQGFSGVGADSVVANNQFSVGAVCPDVRCVQADAQTDANGTTYITFAGSVPGSPGVAQRDPSRKWGHYDTEIPVYVLGFKIQGRLTTASANGSYILQIKSFDVTGGTTAALNQGEIVNSADFNTVNSQIGQPFNFLTYWRDSNFDNVVNSTDFAAINAHLNHSCSNPLNP
jgi:hypothetical protein